MALALPKSARMNLPFQHRPGYHVGRRGASRVFAAESSSLSSQLDVRNPIDRCPRCLGIPSRLSSRILLLPTGNIVSERR
jgi:hypothetical protein